MSAASGLVSVPSNCRAVARLPSKPSPRVTSLQPRRAALGISSAHFPDRLAIAHTRRSDHAVTALPCPLFFTSQEGKWKECCLQLWKRKRCSVLSLTPDFPDDDLSVSADPPLKRLWDGAAFQEPVTGAAERPSARSFRAWTRATRSPTTTTARAWIRTPTSRQTTTHGERPCWRSPATSAVRLAPQLPLEGAPRSARSRLLSPRAHKA